MSEVSIRPVADEELDRVRALIRENWMVEYAHLFSKSELKEMFAGPARPAASWAHERAGPLASLVAVRGDEIAGCVTTERLTSGAVEVSRLYVRVGSHRCGIGTALWSAVADLARAEGERRIHVWTLAEGPAVTFYPRLGCRPARVGTITFGGVSPRPAQEFVYACPDRDRGPH